MDGRCDSRELLACGALPPNDGRPVRGSRCEPANDRRRRARPVTHEGCAGWWHHDGLDSGFLCDCPCHENGAGWPGWDEFLQTRTPVDELNLPPQRYPNAVTTATTTTTTTSSSTDTATARRREPSGIKLGGERSTQSSLRRRDERITDTTIDRAADVTETSPAHPRIRLACERGGKPNATVRALPADPLRMSHRRTLQPLGIQVRKRYRQSRGR